jgi:NADH-quinone oxidoreductase subunit M
MSGLAGLVDVLSGAPLLTLLWGAPMVASAWVGRMVAAERARRAAAAVAGVMVAASLAGLLLPGEGLRWEESAGVGWLRYHVGLDGLNAPMALLTSLILLGVALGAPRGALTPRGLGALLVRAGAIMGCFLTLDALWLVGFWMLALLPGQAIGAQAGRAGEEAGRMYRLYVKGGVAPLVVAVGCLGWVGWQAGLTAPFDVVALGQVAISEGWQWAVFVPLAVAVLMRMGIAPFHGWLPAFARGGAMGLVVLVVGTHMGLFLVVRLMLPLLPAASAAGMPALADVALVSALYGAVWAFGQRDLRGVIGGVTVSQRGLMLLGLASINAQSVSGAMLQFLGTGGAVSGLLLVVWALQARVGGAQIPRYGGLARQAPGLASVSLLFVVASVGFPGSLGFVAEDLLIHGVLEAHPVIAGVVLLATALNGFTLLRAMMQTFWGDSERSQVQVVDLLPRERAVYVGILLLLALGGCFPRALVSQWQPQVDALAAAYERGAPRH